jgi:hypothetical protein
VTYLALTLGTYPPHLDWHPGETRVSTDCGELPTPLPPWLVVVTEAEATEPAAPMAPVDVAAPAAAEE